MRLERAFLLEQLHKHMEYNIDDSDRSSSPPPTPTDKPLRSKRSHRKNTPPPGTQIGGSGMSGQHASPSSVQHHQILHPLNPMSSAQSTPDPSSRPNPFFSSVGGGAITSPHATNGTSNPVLPPPHSLPPLQQPSQPSRYFDPAYDEQRVEENDADFAGRQRAHSSAHAPPPPPPVETREVQNGDGDRDTEMSDAPGGGFTSVNRG